VNRAASIFAAVSGVWFVLLLDGCGGTTEAPPAKTAVAAKTTCPPGSDSSPSDAKPRMTALQAEIRKCYTLATGGAGAEVKVEITIGPSGEVREANVLGTSGDPTARTCLEKTLRAAKFATFCGPDVSIRWTYALR
jgi:outer membrane biosynthesis protein TonB